MKKAIFLFLLETCFSGVTGQSGAAVLRGRILTRDGSPGYVLVQLKSCSKTTLTDLDGRFFFSGLPAGRDTLEIGSGIDSGLQRAVLLRPGLDLDIGDIYVSRKVKLLQDVEMTGWRSKNYKSDYSFFGSKTALPVKDLPQSVSTITRDMIADKMDLTLKDAVGDAAGLNQYSGFDEYTIRGFRAENARYINGFRGYNMTYTSPLLVNIEQVEIIKGPTATLYGNCDPGGTINLVTKKPLEEQQADLGVYFGAWSHSRAVADLTGPLEKKGNMLFRLNIGYDKSGSFRSQQKNGCFELAPSFSLVKDKKWQVNYDFSLTHVNSILDWGQPACSNDSNLRSTPIGLSLSQPGDYLKETDLASILAVSYKFNDHFRFNTGYLFFSAIQSVGSHGFNSYITPDSVSLYYTSWSYRTQTNSLSSWFTYQCRQHAFYHTIVFGYDVIRSAVNLNQSYFEIPGLYGMGTGIVGTLSLKNPVYINQPAGSYAVSSFDTDGADVNGSIYHTQGPYVQDLVIYKNWDLLVSLRQQWYKGDTQDSIGKLGEQIFLPRVGLTWKLTPTLSAYTSFNKGFDAFEASSANQVFGKVPFKPQVSTVYEWGTKAEFFNSKLSATLALYQLTVDNVAVNANVPSNPNLFVQRGQDRSRGLELEAAGNITPNFSLFSSYAHCRAIVTRSLVPSEIGNILENAPLDESSSWVKYRFVHGRLRRLGISLGHSQVGRRTTLDRTTRLPGYWVFNGGLFYRWREINIAFNMYNLTNKVYWMGAYNNISKWPGAPINCLINLSYHFKTGRSGKVGT